MSLLRTSDPSAGLLAALQSLLPQAAACAGGSIADAQGVLWPEEAHHVEGAVERRRAEFRAGRQYARRAMALLGEPLQAVPTDARRAPHWPAGLVGSISHDASLCFVAVARRQALRSVGIDFECDTALEPALAALVASPAERAQSAPGLPPGADLAKLLFVIKEASYKAYWPLARWMLDFGDLKVRLQAGGRFEAVLAPHCPAADGERLLRGRFSWVQGYVLACAHLPVLGFAPVDPMFNY